MHNIELSNEQLGVLAIMLKQATQDAARRRREAGEKGWAGARMAADDTIYVLNQIIRKVEPSYEKVFGKLF